MKNTILSIFFGLVFAFTCLADIPAASTPDVVQKDDVTYTRNGKLGDNSYVITDLVHTNFMKRGTNTFVEMDDEEAEQAIKEPLYGSGIQYSRKSESSATITNPYTGDGVFAYWVAFQYGFEYANVNGKYDCLREKYNGSNGAYMWSTNYYKGINGKKMAFPRPEATNDSTMIYQQYLDEEVGIIVDREWVIEILNAYKNGKLTISQDSTTKKYSITISK